MYLLYQNFSPSFDERYDDDGNFVATPGQRRAVKEAVQLLQEQGHDVFPFTPTGLDKVNLLYGQFLFADEGKSTAALLRHGPVDYGAIGTFYRTITAPMWLRRIAAPIVSALFSEAIGGSFTLETTCNTSFQLWALNALRLEYIEAILKQWERQDVDVVLAPGYSCPAQPIGYPQSQLATISYTCVYNLLNFPAGSVTVARESEADQAALEDYPGREKDLVYGWVKEGTRGAQGMPLNVQVVGRPWTEELVLRVMRELQEDKALPWSNGK